ncbi:outer membrane protein assembly factor BamB family protein [Streptomyces sp. 6N106]|uniref:outer membrane protein assembly factor BamB family protein n=1 Tax=Streptomyces sp. 6N106 TaxID=3457418 RepID=UPI003FD0190C
MATSAKAPARAAVAGGRLVIHGSGGGVAALDARTGRTAWGPREQGSPTALAPAVADGVVYLGGKGLRALVLVSGEERRTHAGQGGTGWTAPAVRGAWCTPWTAPTCRRGGRRTGRRCGRCRARPTTIALTLPSSRVAACGRPSTCAGTRAWWRSKSAAEASLGRTRRGPREAGGSRQPGTACSHCSPARSPPCPSSSPTAHAPTSPRPRRWYSVCWPFAYASPEAPSLGRQRPADPASRVTEDPLRQRPGALGG